MPNAFHQRIVRFLYNLFQAYVRENVEGEIFFAPVPVRLWSGKYREPDLVYLRPTRIRADGYLEGADLVIEVVSDSQEARKRDLETKRSDYARAGIAEYWIVDPLEQQIHVLTLEGDTYRLYGKFGIDERATSVLLPGLSVSTNDVFASAR